jgi:hypothetical protein
MDLNPQLISLKDPLERCESPEHQDWEHCQILSHLDADARCRRIGWSGGGQRSCQGRAKTGWTRTHGSGNSRVRFPAEREISYSEQGHSAQFRRLDAQARAWLGESQDGLFEGAMRYIWIVGWPLTFSCDARAHRVRESP